MSCILLIPILISDTTLKSKNNVFFSVFGKPKFLLIVARVLYTFVMLSNHFNKRSVTKFGVFFHIALEWHIFHLNNYRLLWIFDPK